MAQGKYQIKYMASKRANWAVYNIMDNETLCYFSEKEKAQEYAAKLNGEIPLSIGEEVCEA